MQDIKETIDRDLLWLATAGSVDNGKSTLIGRLLHDCHAIYQDQLSSLEKISFKKGLSEVDLSLLTDGLSAEREQGITIDVAYRYFNTDRRRIIIADVPGHEQYTRNMVTGCSNADAVLILMDAQKGLTTQSKRHLFIASMMKIPNILIVMNKMDAVDYRQDVFAKIKQDCLSYISRLNIKEVDFIPVSAIKGDMVVFRGEAMPWYKDTTIIEYLNKIKVSLSNNEDSLRLPIQLTVRGEGEPRCYTGKMESGVLKKGDEVLILPSKIKTAIKAIFIGKKKLEMASAGQSVSVMLVDEVDVGRGDLIVRQSELPEKANEIEAMLCWMDNNPLEMGRSYLIKQMNKTCRVDISNVSYRVNIDNLYHESAASLRLNEIGRVFVKTNNELLFDAYEDNKYTGSFILIDEINKSTAAAGIILN